MKFFNSFAGAVMNKDLEVRLFPKSIYLDAKNIRIISAGENNSRSVKFPLGNTAVTSLSLGTNAVSTGYCIDGLSNKIYWVVRSDSGSYVCEYDTDTDTESIVLGDNRGASTRVFNFPSTGNVEMRVLNDNDNGRNFLFITDGIGEPYYFEIEKAKTLPDNSFTLQNVSLIKAPPVSAPTLVLGDTTSSEENNIKVKFLSFAYRYRYGFGEHSALSQFSEFAFEPSSFSYNYNTGTNDAMFNKYSKVTISFNTGVADVKGVDIIVKESGSNTAYIVESFDKTNQGWSNNSTQSIVFSNSKIYRALDSAQLTRVFDNVPINAKSLEVIGNRVVFANYTEGYNLLDGSDNIIFPDFSLGYKHETGTAGTAHKQVKSNRDYEIAVAYVDGRGRMTTPLTSEGNTAFILNEHAKTKNTLQVSISSKAPAWATGYRFFIKQSKKDYDVIAPLVFYRNGIYAWIRIDANDRNKLTEGKFLYVKSDTAGLKSSTVRTKILEIKEQERNFLIADETTKNGPATFQQEGTYFRVQVEGYSLNEDSISIFTGGNFKAFRSDDNGNNFNNQQTYIEPTYYNGIGLNDLTRSGSYTSSDDIRYEVYIDGVGSPNTFKWREVNVSTAIIGSFTENVNITAGSQSLSNGISIAFGQTTGHTLGDKWVISCKTAARTATWNEQPDQPDQRGRRAIMNFESKDVGDEGISAGALITLTYDDTASQGDIYGATGLVTETLTCSKYYPNLEEWFFGDNVISQMSYPDNTSRIIFRRGALSENSEILNINPSGRMYLSILSACNFAGSSKISIATSFSITEFDNNILFETVPLDENSDIFYELSRTYPISGDNHLGGGVNGNTNQNYGVTNALINLEYFNSFGWYNGFESIKIGDTFNEKTMFIDTKPLVPIENYQQIKRIASLTYSNVYEGTTQFNALNEFNLAKVNYKDMDTKYGSIQKLHSKDTNLMVFQEDKTHHVLFSKSVLYGADGKGNITQSSDILGDAVAYEGEFGIGLHPESFSFFGNRIYHIDHARGALMRLSLNGYTEVSQKGFSDYFRTLPDQTSFVGGYDPYNDEYLINVKPDGSPLTLSFIEGEEGGFSSFYEYEPERLVGVNNRLYSIKNGQLWLHDSNTTRNNFYGNQRTASITTLFNDSPDDVKHWKSINTESTSAWNVSIKTPFAIGTIDTSEFSLEEGEWYAYIRQNEKTGADTGALSTYQGLGEIQTIVGTTLSMDIELPRNISIGDAIYLHNSIGDTLTNIGSVTALDVSAGTVTLNSVSGLSVGNFILYGKNARVEGEAIKGYYMETTLTNTASTDEELFVIKAEAVRSFD